MRKLFLILFIFYSGFIFSQSQPVLDFMGVKGSQYDLDLYRSISVSLGSSISDTEHIIGDSYIYFDYRYSFKNHVSISSGIRYIFEADGISSGLEMPILMSYKIFSHLNSDNLGVKILDIILPDEIDLIAGGYVGYYKYPEYLSYDETKTQYTSKLDNKYGYGFRAGVKSTYFIRKVGISLSIIDKIILSDNVFIEKRNTEGVIVGQEYVKRMLDLNIGLVYRFGDY